MGGLWVLLVFGGNPAVEGEVHHRSEGTSRGSVLVDSADACRSAAAIRIRNSAAAAALLRIGGPFVSNSTLIGSFLRSATGLADCCTGRACDTGLSTEASETMF